MSSAQSANPSTKQRTRSSPNFARYFVFSDFYSYGKDRVSRAIIIQVTKEADVLRLRLKELGEMKQTTVAEKEKKIAELELKVAEGETQRRKMHNLIQVRAAGRCLQPHHRDFPDKEMFNLLYQGTPRKRQSLRQGATDFAERQHCW